MGTRMAGRRALVVGGGQLPSQTYGNGRATAVTFAREGAQVSVVDLYAERARSTAEEIVAAGGVAHWAAGDVTNSADCEAFVQLAVERMGDRRGRLYPGQSVLREREPGQIRRENAERVSRGADVVVKPRQRELRGAGPASDRLRAFYDQHVGAVACQFHSCSKAVGAAADDHSVQARRHVDLYAAGVAATTSPLARTIPSSQTASTRPPWNCCS